MRDDGHAPGVLQQAKRVLCVVQQSPGKPLSTRHLALAQHYAVGAASPDSGELPDRRPEPLEIFYRPLPQGTPVAELKAAIVAQPVDVSPELGRLEHVSRRLSEHGRRKAVQTQARLSHGSGSQEAR